MTKSKGLRPPHPHRGRPYGPRVSDAEYRSPYRKVLGLPAHRLIVEQRTGLKLKPHQQVHHVDPDDKVTNQGLFVVCEDAAYHQLLERRGRALRACGNANWRQCYRCKKWDDPKNLLISRRNEDRRGDRVGDVVHVKRHGVCVDMPTPRDEHAYLCEAAPRRRHGVNSKGEKRRKGVSSARGLEATCFWCRATIRRDFPRSVRFYRAQPPEVA